MADSLLRPDSAGSMPGGTTLADTVTGGATPGAGSVGGAPTSNDAVPGNPMETGPGLTGQGPSGLGTAVPTDEALEGSGALGDQSGMGDSHGAGDTGAPAPPHGATDMGANNDPVLRETDAEGGDDGGVPTGGLQAGDALGATPGDNSGGTGLSG